MKKILTYIILSLTLLTLGSCRRTTDNGKIDGQWQIREIYHIADGTTVNPETRMICVQLELMQLGNPSWSPTLTGVIDYHKGDSQIGVDFRYNPSDDLLALFGFSPTEAPAGATGKYCLLQIEKLDSKHLVLRSPIAVITCRKY